MGYLDTIRRLKEAKAEAHSIARPWLAAWRELAELTYGITPTDGRLHPVLDALNRCDEAFYSDDWPTFEQGAQEIRSILMTGPHGQKENAPIGRVHD